MKKSIATLIAVQIYASVAYAQLQQDAIDLYETSAGDSTVYSDLIISITFALIALFAVWILVAAFRQWADGDMQFMSLFFMIARTGIIISLVSVLFTGF